MNLSLSLASVRPCIRLQLVHTLLILGQTYPADHRPADLACEAVHIANAAYIIYIALQLAVKACPITGSSVDRDH